MDELFDRSYQLVKENIADNIDSTIIELLTNSVLALFLIKPNLILNKIPSILNELNIIIDHCDLSDIAFEKFHYHIEENEIDSSVACVVREAIIEEGFNLTEKRHLIISLDNITSYYEVILVLIHELIHLLRFSWIRYENGKVITKNGLYINTYDCERQKEERANYYLEEGIVQYYANIAISELITYYDDMSLKKGALNSFKLGQESLEISSCFVQTALIKKLTVDQEFAKLLEDTFEEDTIISKLENYFNNIMTSDEAFENFSKLMDEAYIDLTSGNGISVNNSSLINLGTITNQFISHTEKNITF